MYSTNIYLRIIAGTHGGREIKAPPSNKSMTTRPTLDRVRESLFDILARRIDGMRILDLCAGTGALGLESLSRGAKMTTFVESDTRNIKLIRENVEKLAMGEKCWIVKGELPYALAKVKGPFEIVFFDPPYSSDLVTRVLPRLASKKYLVPNAIVVVERDRRSAPIKFSQFAIDRRHRIGDTELWFLRYLPPGSRLRGDE
jgi:16S rRNA (guanine966-N2)-methyltransferase